MSGHSKWSTIKRKKGKTDAERGKMFSKLVREIILATKQGGGPDLTMNSRLRLAVQKAKDANMPNDNVSRAIQKGSGDGADSNLEEIVYEAYAPFGVGLLIETLSDNKNRTLPNIKSVLNKYGSSLATKGAVSYNFEQKGYFIFEPGISEEEVMEVATMADAEDIDIKDDGSVEVITEPKNFEQVRKAFEENNLNFISAEITMLPKTFVTLTDEQSEKVMNIINKLEDDDDVQNVYTNS
jgi:YebC/PmpR family DNA-binding regulatory protein